MKRYASVFLQIVILFIGVGALAFMLWEPHLEGRNVNATVFEIYFKDPFLAYAYLASIPFFTVLYQVFTLLNDARRSLESLRTIKLCGLLMLAFAAGGIIWIMLTDSDDRAGGIVMGAFAVLVSLSITGAATVFENLLQKNEYAKERVE